MQLRGYEILPCRNILLSPSLSISLLSLPRPVLSSILSKWRSNNPKIRFIIDTRGSRLKTSFSLTGNNYWNILFSFSLFHPSPSSSFFHLYPLNDDRAIKRQLIDQRTNKNFFTRQERKKIKSIYQKNSFNKSFFSSLFVLSIRRYFVPIYT